jgi:mRNA-degrading endonuclease RelE of RelBE toxin-antitoxin system
MDSRNRVAWSPKAAKQLLKFPKHAQRQIVDATSTLEQMPNCPNVKALSNHHYGYRLRVGDYRVLFDWMTVIKIVEIQEVRKRDESTY